MRGFASQPGCYGHWGEINTRSDVGRIASDILAALGGRTNTRTKVKRKMREWS